VHRQATLASFRTPKRRIVELFLEEMLFRGPVHAGSVVIAAFAAIAASCAHPRAHAIAPPPLVRVGTTEAGIASWYGIPYHGRQTASGEIYDMYRLTAAHRNLPFQTWVEVENLSNGKRVDVRINDRGPFVRDRIIDLSQTAASQIDMLRPGTARVRLTVIARPTNVSPEAAPVAALRGGQDRDALPPPSAKSSRAPSAPSVGSPVASAPVPASPPPVIPMPRYAVQAGAFADRERAEAFRQTMNEAFADARTLIDTSRNPPLWRVLVGREMTMEQAAALAARVRTEAGAGIVVPEPQPTPQ
jgi:rare lipoprotein A